MSLCELFFVREILFFIKNKRKNKTARSENPGAGNFKFTEMKFTAKNLQALTGELFNLKSDIIAAKAQCSIGSTSTNEMEKRREDVQIEIDKFPKVAIKYYIGSRDYCEEAVKIGAFYFKNGHKLTKSKGYHCIEEIPEITDKMKTEMYEDMMYY